MREPFDVLVISNGHGEDQVGARIVASLHDARPSARIAAYPTVGEGTAYASGPATTIGVRGHYPSGGVAEFGSMSFVHDLRSGLLRTLAAQVRSLAVLEADRVVAVGDVLAELLGTRPKARLRFAVQTLVTASTEDGGARFGMRSFRERFTPLERTLLRARYDAVFVRDATTARRLGRARVRNVGALGNPMMDQLDVDPIDLPTEGARVALLPGTRAYALTALHRMCQAARSVPEATFAVPWARGEWPEPPVGWERRGTRGVWERWTEGATRVHVLAHAFAEIVAWAQVAIGTAGTANEQAAGRGVPVVTFAAGAPHGTAFVAKQQRLLGDALIVVPNDRVAIAAAVRSLLRDPDERLRRGRAGNEAMGGPGGAAAIANAIWKFDPRRTR